MKEGCCITALFLCVQSVLVRIQDKRRKTKENKTKDERQVNVPH